MKAALTAEEWGRSSFTRGSPDNVHIVRQGGVLMFDLQHSGAPGFPDSETRHAIAALALYGQPFGFTQEDVRFLENLATMTIDEAVERQVSLTERIRALLPPSS